MAGLMLEIHGPGDDGSLIDVRSRHHMQYVGRDSRVAPWPSLVGWANRNWDWHGNESWEAMYAGPYRIGAIQRETFDDPWRAVQWIAARFSEERAGTAGIDDSALATVAALTRGE